MAKKGKEVSLKKEPILNLLARLEVEKDDDLWMKYWEEIMERSPFQGLDECIGNNETRIEELEGKIKKLESLFRLHRHMGDDVVVKLV